MIPHLYYSLGKTRFDEMLQEASQERLARQQAARPTTLRERSGNLLIAAGQALQARSQARRNVPAMRTR